MKMSEASLDEEKDECQGGTGGPGKVSEYARVGPALPGFVLA
jgi:hypothetical protein